MIDETVGKNFDTLGRAFEEKCACLMECKRKSDGKIVNLICAVNAKDGIYTMIPFAEMIDMMDESPFDQYYPPDSTSDSGYFEGNIYEEAPKH
jgi:hypothetical protein